MPLSLYLVNAVYQSQASLLRSKYQGLKKREESLRDSKGTQHEDRRQIVLQVKHTWSDLYFYRQNDELVLVWGVGFNPDESCVVVRISGREARSHHTLCLKWRYFLQKKKKPWINNSVFIKKKKKKSNTWNWPIIFQCLPVAQWEVQDGDLPRWSTFQQPGGGKKNPHYSTSVQKKHYHKTTL